MKRFLLGFTVVSLFYLILNWLAFIGYQDIVRPVGYYMQLPFSFVYDSFNLIDDDKRIVYPILLTSVLWGIVGGGFAVIIGKLFKKKENKQL